jgi:hypothetical protein
MGEKSGKHRATILRIENPLGIHRKVEVVVTSKIRSYNREIAVATRLLV